MWTSNLYQPDLGLSEVQIGDLGKTTHIIHAAWPVNFNLAFPAFESSIKGLHNLIQLSFNTKTLGPAKLLFCSSIAVALRTRRPAIVAEAPVEFSQCSSGGYGRSKFVAEEIVRRATEDFGADAHILRVGQIVGNSTLGAWNDTEAIPLIIRSALTLKVLPKLNTSCSWLPVDTLACAIIDLCFNKTSKLVYNLSSPKTFDWATALLPALQSAGLEFTPVSFDLWLQKLKEYASAATESELRQNPAIKLVEYYERAYGDGASQRDLAFSIDQALTDSPSLRSLPDLVESGYIMKFLKFWMKSW